MSTENLPTEVRGSLDAALARAQKAFPPIKKTKKATVKGKTKAGNDYNYDYAYADLADVLTAILPCLTAEEICVRQPIRRVEGRMYLVTELHHSSGDWASDDGIPLGPNNDPQAFGAEHSYARRQGLCGLAGVAPEENEDTQVSKTAQQRGKNLTAAQQRTEAASRAAVLEDATPITNEESEHIKSELKRTQRKAAQLYEFINQKPGSLIPARKYSSIVAWFKTSLMPESVAKAFSLLDWTPEEQTKFCESKGNDWTAIQTQLDAMLTEGQEN
jgi:hypothetical protein